MSAAAAPSTPARASACGGCGTELPPDWLHCPACRALVHAGALHELAAAADACAEQGELERAREHWRRALALLPRDAAQHAVVAERIDALGRRIEREGPGRVPDAAPDRGTATAGAEATRPAPASRASLRGAAAGAAGAGLLLWKFQGVLVFALTKAKLLVLGLGKASTFFSMLLSLGVYWSVFGWSFAAGLVLSLYVHEIGHVAALRGLGIRAAPPMFVPGLGAFVRAKEYPASPREDARVGLAGPLWGLAAAAAAWAAFLASGAPLLAAIARTGAWLNLFNLIPVWQLDGSRGMRALSRPQRVFVVAVAAAVGLAAGEALYLLIGAAALARVFTGEAPAAGDRRAAVELALLLVLLGALTTVAVPGVPAAPAR